MKEVSLPRESEFLTGRAVGVIEDCARGETLSGLADVGKACGSIEQALALAEDRFLECNDLAQVLDPRLGHRRRLCDRHGIADRHVTQEAQTSSFCRSWRMAGGCK